MMGHKLLLSMILYAAGFFTAVYFLAPSPVQAIDRTQVAQRSTEPQNSGMTADYSETNKANSDIWMTKVRTGIDTCILFAEEQTLRAADLIRSKMGQGKDQSGQ